MSASWTYTTTTLWAGQKSTIPKSSANEIGTLPARETQHWATNERQETSISLTSAHVRCYHIRLWTILENFTNRKLQWTPENQQKRQGTSFPMCSCPHSHSAKNHDPYYRPRNNARLLNNVQFDSTFQSVNQRCSSPLLVDGYVPWQHRTWTSDWCWVEIHFH